MLAVTAFYFLDLIGIDRTRHHMTLAFSMLVLFYGGVQYVLRYGLKHRQIHVSPIPALLVATVLICAGYGIYGKDWRAHRWFEFEQKRAGTESNFEFLAAQVKAGDIIVTDETSYYYFWRRFKTCRATPLTLRIATYSCYPTPFYIIRDDMRVVTFMLNMADIQQALQELDRLGRLQKVKRIWMVGIQDVAAKPIALSPHFAFNFFAFFSHEEKQWYARQLGQMIAEQEAFEHYVYRVTNPRKITYVSICDGKGPKTEEGIQKNCMTSFLAVALPRQDIYEWMVNHAPYHDPEAFLHDVNNKRKHGF